MQAETELYPAEPVRVIEPFGAGGGFDVIARAVSRRLSELWGHPVMVENHPGAGSTAAPALVGKSPADGYTLLVNSSAVHVPAPPADGIVGTIAKTVAGDTTYLLAPIPLVMADIRNGKLRALGVSTSERSPLLPDAPALSEAGLSNFNYAIWYGVWVRVNTPQFVVDQLAKDIARALDAPDLHQWLVKHGAKPMSMTQPEFARFVLSESENVTQILRLGGINAK